MWEAFGNPKDPVNTLPGGTFNSAGGKPAEPRWWDALRFDQFNKEGRPSWYQTGCARDSLMVGIGAGGALGGLRFILKGLASMLATTNWAVGGFCVTSSLMYYWCEQRRLEEAKGMAAAVAGMKMLNEKRAKEKAAAAEAAIKAEEVQKKSKWW